MSGQAFSFLRFPSWPPKPRAKGLFFGTDRNIPLGEQEDFLKGYAEIIDYAKLADHAGIVSRYSESWLKKKVDLYRRNNISTFIGGITFEIAVLQGKVDEYFNKLKELGFSGVEVSYDTIPEPSPKERAAIIRKATSLELEVFTEVGRKFPDKPLEVKETVEMIQADLDLGVHTVTIEASETAILKDTNPQFVVDIANAVGLEKIVYECSPPDPWDKMAVWLIKTLGPGVNLENVPLQDCWRIYAMRHGMSRDTGYRFMSEGQKA